MKAFAVAGITKSGKTAIIENIIKELKRRKSAVGSIKEIHFEPFAMDTPGTNTYRHRAAGSELVTARGCRETDILFSAKLPIEDILAFYTQDYVVMEGVTDYNVPIILCAHSLKEIKEHKQKPYFKRVFAISGVVSNLQSNCYDNMPIINGKESITKLADLIEEKVFEILPDFPPACCSACGFDCRELCARILKGESKRSECKLGEAKIILRVDGKKINLVPFVQDMMADTIKALVGNLKGCSKGKKIEIVLDE